MLQQNTNKEVNADLILSLRIPEVYIRLWCLIQNGEAYCCLPFLPHPLKSWVIEHLIKNFCIIEEFKKSNVATAHPIAAELWSIAIKNYVQII